MLKYINSYAELGETQKVTQPNSKRQDLQPINQVLENMEHISC